MCLSVVNGFANCLCTYWSVAAISCLFVFDSCKKIVKLGNQNVMWQYFFATYLLLVVWISCLMSAARFVRKFSRFGSPPLFLLILSLAAFGQDFADWPLKTTNTTNREGLSKVSKNTCFREDLFPQFTVAKWINNCDINKAYKNEPWKIYIVLIYWHMKGLVTRLNLKSARVFFEKSGSFSA